MQEKKLYIFVLSIVVENHRVKCKNNHASNGRTKLVVYELYADHKKSCSFSKTHMKLIMMGKPVLKIEFTVWFF